MSEAVLQSPPRSFHIKLHVDPADDNEIDLPLTTKSWRVQLLRLLQRAPKPVPVFCEEPRSFPHFENGSRISESSWTSDTTRSTDVTRSSFSSFIVPKSSNIITPEKKGVEENHQNATVLRKNDSSPRLAVQSTTCRDKDAVDGNILPKIVSEETDTGTNGVCLNRKDEVNGKLSNCSSSPQENSNSKVHDNSKHKLQKDVENCRSSSSVSRNTLSLSIHGDSQYWEKFRHSKDYQSSLMIETICNEVFNLKPSLRYKSLMKLSGTGNENISKNKKEIESSPQPSVVECDDNDGNGIKVEILEEKGAGTKGAKSSSILSALKTRGDERKKKDAKGKVESAISFWEERIHQKDDDATEDNDDDDDDNDNDEKEIKMEVEGHQYAMENKTRSSITSSVFTTTTATTEGAEEYDRRRRERILLLESFGQAFHGYLTKGETERLLQNDGQYLIRQMWNEDGLIVSFMFDRKILNYRLLYDVGVVVDRTNQVDTGFPENDVQFKYYLEDRRKCYHSVDELVREGLITLHLDENAGSYIDLLMELAQFQKNENLLQTPATTPGSRKNSLSASFRMARLTFNSSSAFRSRSTSGRGSSGGGSNGVDGDNRQSSITDGRISMDIALLIHYFEEEIFDGLAKCQVCTNGIWGQSWKGLRCRDCSLTVHESCTDSVETECKPDLTVLSPFSTDLTSLVKGSRGSSGTNGSHCPPYILTTCINEVEARGLAIEGIYRICGSVDEIEKLKSLFEKDKINTNISGHPTEIHSITSLIKLFLRQLPDPLITHDAFEEFTQENTSGQITIDTARILVRCLPPAHKLTLKYVLEHLQRVANEKATNKMTAFNLSSVFMPSIMRPTNMFNSLESGTKLLNCLISHTEEVFKI